MSTEAMTRAELIEFVRANFDPEDIWSDYHDLTGCLDAAGGEGWVDPSDPRTYEIWHVETMAEHLGLTLGPTARTIEAYHDSEGHTGAVQWCNYPMCNGKD